MSSRSRSPRSRIRRRLQSMHRISKLPRLLKRKKRSLMRDSRFFRTRLSLMQTDIQALLQLMMLLSFLQSRPVFPLQRSRNPMRINLRILNPRSRKELSARMRQFMPFPRQYAVEDSVLKTRRDLREHLSSSVLQV